MHIIEQIIQYSIKNNVESIILKEGVEPIAEINGQTQKISNRIIIKKEDIEFIVKTYSPEKLNEFNVKDVFNSSFIVGNCGFICEFKRVNNVMMCTLKKHRSGAQAVVSSIEDGVPLIEKIMQYAIANKVSDIHLTEGEEATVRINGSLERIFVENYLSREDIEYLIDKYSPELAENLKTIRSIDSSFTFGDTRFRANFFIQRKKLALSLRLIPSKIPLMESLNLPDAISGILSLKNGLVLVTGATGSGKSTTIASIINQINLTKAEHIVTVEDPIEFIYENKKSLIHQREIGSDCPNFGKAIMDLLREDPDVIVLGEIRTHESISSALTLAETGHLVFATLHTKSAAESIDRIIDVFPPDQQAQIRVQLANTLKYVVAQRLVPTVDKKGRLPLIELMIVNPAISAAITNSAPNATIRDQIELNHKKIGSQTFSQCAKDFVERNLVSLDSVKEFIESNPLDK